MIARLPTPTNPRLPTPVTCHSIGTPLVGTQILVKYRGGTPTSRPSCIGSHCMLWTLIPVLTKGSLTNFYGTGYLSRGSIVGWGTMLQAGRSLVRVPGEVDFFNLADPSSCTMAPESTRPLPKMSTRSLPWGKKRPVFRADNPSALRMPNVWKYGSINLSQP
jgi:hypothetical protein